MSSRAGPDEIRGSALSTRGPSPASPRMIAASEQGGTYGSVGHKRRAPPTSTLRGRAVAEQLGYTAYDGRGRLRSRHRRGVDLADGTTDQPPALRPTSPTRGSSPTRYTERTGARRRRRDHGRGRLPRRPATRRSTSAAATRALHCLRHVTPGLDILPPSSVLGVLALTGFGDADGPDADGDRPPAGCGRGDPRRARRKGGRPARPTQDDETDHRTTAEPTCPRRGRGSQQGAHLRGGRRLASRADHDSSEAGSTPPARSTSPASISGRRHRPPGPEASRTRSTEKGRAGRADEQTRTATRPPDTGGVSPTPTHGPATCYRQRPRGRRQRLEACPGLSDAGRQRPSSPRT